MYYYKITVSSSRKGSSHRTAEHHLFHNREDAEVFLKKFGFTPTEEGEAWSFEHGQYIFTARLEQDLTAGLPVV